jgi:hypothetical protein
MTELVVCGFYTRDYFHWVPPLQLSLDHFGCPHDFVETAKVEGGWEANTMRKATEVMNAMARHPDRVIVFIDVDARVCGDLTPLTQLAGDVAFHVQARRRRNGGVRFRVRSGTLVIAPTPAARRFIETWAILSAGAHYGDVDQTTLMLAIGLVPGVAFTPLDLCYCATAGDHVANPVILHDQASRDVRKVKPWQRLVRRLIRRQRPPVSVPCAS